LDPQANTTSGLGIQNTSGYINSYELLVEHEEVPTEKIMNCFEIPNLKIIPANIDLAGAEIELVSSLSRETILKRRLKPIAHFFDFIFIDCPPSLGLLTLNSLVASDFVLIPVQAEYFALEGLGLLVDTVNIVKSNLNPNLEVGGVLITMFDQRTNLSKDVYKEINTFFEKKLFSTIIPRNIKLSEAPSHGLPISKYAPYSSGSISFKNLSSEFIKRFDNINLVNPLQKNHE
jgi:chromosome partitioning protein